ncbi:hypothetical protein FKP32DRAFT_942061 [Trametes sanguinea]|nr:hypothetical protein FKP32DRAFT_942061 [Trametes sanguinea]
MKARSPSSRDYCAQSRAMRLGTMVTIMGACACLCAQDERIGGTRTSFGSYPPPPSLNERELRAFRQNMRLDGAVMQSFVGGEKKLQHASAARGFVTTGWTERRMGLAHARSLRAEARVRTFLSNSTRALLSLGTRHVHKAEEVL